jgi:sterol 14-demethylase
MALISSLTAIGADFAIFHLLVVVLCFYFLFSIVSRSLRKKVPNAVPRVEGGLPFLGHAIEYGTNPYKFVERCRKKYGRAFM